nr:phospholysine phosphohistidine inorganic pyrophosphate phosphatase isoform X2 [Rattus norvegicus]
MAAWAERLSGVRGVLLDISGVLYDSGTGGGAAIAGSVEAVARLKRSPLKVRFCTNESQKSRRELVGVLQRLGFDISEGEVTAPAPATCQILKERGLRPHLLIHEGVRSEFDDIDMSNPNCVVIADAGEGFSYQNMNRAFQVLMELENPVLISLGKGLIVARGYSRLQVEAWINGSVGQDGEKSDCSLLAVRELPHTEPRYYKETSGLMLDVGGYMKALEYACGIEAEVVGKPSPEFFRSALQAIGVEAHQAIMIGDDIVGDVGGAQQCGMRALQVRTGKFRTEPLEVEPGLWNAHQLS